MPKKVRKCYMCDEDAISGDHVPPKCIFPEQKDADGVDFRRNLITVPACDLHNNALSGDDQAFLTLVSTHLQNNELVQGIQKKKLERTFRKDKKLWQQLFEHNPLSLQPTRWGMAVTFDLEAELQASFLRCSDKVARGLFYHRHKVQWKEEVFIYPFNLTSDTSDYKYLALRDLAIIARRNILLYDLTKHGENPSIFYYQELTGFPGIKSFMRLVFYEGAEIIATFPDRGSLTYQGIIGTQ